MDYKWMHCRHKVAGEKVNEKPVSFRESGSQSNSKTITRSTETHSIEIHVKDSKVKIRNR